MLIHDRRRCRPADPEQVRDRLTLAQRAKLGEQRQEGWRLAFVRGTPAVAHLVHATLGYAIVTRDGRLFRVRRYGMRSEADPADPADSTGRSVRINWPSRGAVASPAFGRASPAYRMPPGQSGAGISARA